MERMFCEYFGEQLTRRENKTNMHSSQIRGDYALQKSIFIPLTKESFGDFLRRKTWELRRAEKQWNEKQIFFGRKATLSCGYSGRRLRGIVGQVIFGSLESIFRQVPLCKIEPRAKSKKEAISMNIDMLGTAEKYIAFEIILKN